MKTIILSFAVALVIAALGVVCAYMQRGYWAIGSECILPMIVLVVLLFTGGKEENE